MNRSYALAAAAFALAASWATFAWDPKVRAQSTIRFSDVAGRSTFSYVSNNDFTSRKFFPQPMCGGFQAGKRLD
jgi:hypothetical protein